MRLASVAFLRRAAAMSASSSPYSRRGYPRPRRGYSARPSPPDPYAGPEIVSGDSHLSTVRAANDSLRRGDAVRGPPPAYSQGPHPPQQQYGYGYGYGYGQPRQPGPSYGFVPYNYGHPQPQPPPPGPQYGYGAPHPYFHGHPQPHPHGRPPMGAGFRHGAPQRASSLPGYRRLWRFARQRPPQQAERFKVLSYNILADYLAQEHRFLYEGIPSFIMDWNWRKDKLIFEFRLWSPDILCLQEVDRFTDLEQEMATQGYNGIWKMRTGNAADGCAIFWRTTRFQLCYEEDIEFNKLGLRDNVAQICVLELVAPQNVHTDSANLSTSPSHLHQAKRVIVCNIHVLYNPKRGDIKLGQVRTLLDRAYSVSKTWNDAPVILCGDFNSTPKSPLYNFMSERKLDLSGLVKTNISGQQTSGSSQGLYIGPNIYRSHQPFCLANSSEGNVTSLNDRKPKTEITKLVQNICPARRGPVLSDISSESRFDSGSSNIHGNNIPSCSTIDEQGLLNCLESPGNDAYGSDVDAHANKNKNEVSFGFGGIKSESGGPAISDVPSVLPPVCSEIFQPGSCEMVDSSQLLSSDDLPGDVISESTDELLAVSKGKHDEKENAIESMLSGQENVITNEPELSDFNSSQNYDDALQRMDNMRLEGEISTKSNDAVPDACSDHYSSEVISKHSVSCRDESENSSCVFKDGTTTGKVVCTDLNSDPSFFEELSGGNDCLFEEEYQVPSDGLTSSHQMGISSEEYHRFDQYRWTPDEIKTATGNAECTSVEHSLKLRSVYTDVEDVVGTKDANKEPLVTSYNRKFMGTVDYIWASEDLQTVGVLDTFPKEIMKQTSGFPTKKYGSDHIALACELVFRK